MNSFFPVNPGLKALADFRLKPVLRQGVLSRRTLASESRLQAEAVQGLQPRLSQVHGSISVPPTHHAHPAPPLWPADFPRSGRGRSGRGGFTLIEILIATTILLIIVLMMSMVFQQSSGAFQSGTNRVNAQKVLRGILGVIARDMALAADSRYYPGLDNDFGAATRVAFVALTGNPDAAGRRSPQWIEFSYSGGKVTRNCTDLKWSTAGKEWTKDSASYAQESVLNPDYDLLEFSFEATDHPQDTSGTWLPLRVDVYGKLETAGKFTFVRGRSAGKDREWGTDDDIIAGGQ